MIFADAALARRLEAAEAANARGCTAVYPEAAVLEVAGGCAVFAGADFTKAVFLESKLTGAVFEGATLIKATFVTVNADGAVFRGARQRGFSQAAAFGKRPAPVSRERDIKWDQQPTHAQNS